MILLRDEVRIDATPEQVFDWLAHFQEHYLAWHPDHVECRYLRGSSILEKDAILYVEEYLHGNLHKLKLRATKVIPDSRLEYTAGFGIGGAFEVQPGEDGAPSEWRPLKRDGVLFIAEITIGLGVPGPGSWLDRMMERVLAGRIKAMEQHMAEEGENLKRWLEQRPS
jgi:uncharacterized protein YndB with AHSA1/START domain